MDAPAYTKIQSRHVEESRKWPDIRSYAAEVLRRQQTKKGTTSRRGSASQHQSALRRTDNANQPTRTPSANFSAPLGTIEKTRRATQMPNHMCYQHLEQTTARENTTAHPIPDNFTFQNMLAPSHVPNMTAPSAMNDSNLYATRKNHDQGMDEASFQRLLAGIQTKLPIIPKPSATSTIPRSINPGFPFFANKERRGIITRDPLLTDSQVKSYQEHNYPGSCLIATRPEDIMSSKQTSADSAMIAVKSRPNETRKEPTSGVKGVQKSLTKGSRDISDGVSRKSKPITKVGTLKKKDGFFHHNGSGKSYERHRNLKAHSERYIRQMSQDCPKKEEVCLLCFTWRSYDCPHFKSIHKYVVPNSRSDESEAVTNNPVTGTENLVSGQNTSPFLGLHSGTSSTVKLGSRVPRVSKNGGVQKANTGRPGRLRKTLPAVALCQPSSQELAGVGTAALRKLSGQNTAMHAPDKSVRAGAIIPLLSSVQATRCNAPGGMVDSVDPSLFVSSDVEVGTPPDESDVVDVLFEGMDAGFPGDFPLSMINLPPPEEFFHGT